MSAFEETLDSVEAAALEYTKAARALTRATGKIRRAAKVGKIADLRDSGALDARLDDLRRTVEQLRACAASAAEWPSEPDENDRAFADRYSSELGTAARGRGLHMTEMDDRLISFPSTVRVMPKDRVVVIDQKRVPGIRPSKVVDRLLTNSRNLRKYKPERVLEAIWAAYSDLTADAAPSLPMGDGPVVPLTKIYRSLTRLPGTTRLYTKVDFARDLYLLEYNDIRATRKGVAFNLLGSSATRRRSAYFSFVGADGSEAKWSAIRFRTGK